MCLIKNFVYIKSLKASYIQDTNKKGSLDRLYVKGFVYFVDKPIEATRKHCFTQGTNWILNLSLVLTFVHIFIADLLVFERVVVNVIWIYLI